MKTPFLAIDCSDKGKYMYIGTKEAAKNGESQRGVSEYSAITARSTEPFYREKRGESLTIPTSLSMEENLALTVFQVLQS